MVSFLKKSTIGVCPLWYSFQFSILNFQFTAAILHRAAAAGVSLLAIVYCADDRDYHEACYGNDCYD